MHAAITGLGVVSPAGLGVPAFRQGLSLSHSFLAPVRGHDVSDCRCRVGGQVPDEGVRVLLSRFGLSEEDRPLALLLGAAEEALRSAGLSSSSSQTSLPVREGESPRTRWGVILGTSLGGTLRWESARRRGSPPGTHGPSSTGYGAPTEALARHLGAEGPVLTITTACTSSTVALGLAGEWIEDGEADVVLAGGVDALCRFVHGGFESLRALSPGEVRPFGRDREGLQLGEGAAVLVVESDAHLKQRQGRCLSRISGAATAGDAFHLTAPHREGRGMERALTEALTEARLTLQDLDLVNAHATGTPFNDAMEAKVLARMAGDRPLPVNAIKSRFGHTLGAAGALEAVMLVLALQEGWIPGTLLSGDRDPEAPPGLVLGPGRKTPLRHVASLSAAFGGHNAALVLSAAEP